MHNSFDFSEAGSPEISIIIVNWNTKDFLRACLESVYKYPPAVDFDVVVVDNASTDGSQEMVEADFPQARLIQNEANMGFAKANNQAIRESKARFALLLNSDAEVLDGSIDGLYNLLVKNPKVAVAGPLIRNPGGRIEESCGAIQTPFAILATKLTRLNSTLFRFMRKWASHRKPQGLERVDWVTGACMMIRCSALDQVGLFDENIFMYFEDADLCYRMRKAGWLIMVDSSIEIFHYRGASNSGKKRSSISYKKSRRYFYSKHF